MDGAPADENYEILSVEERLSHKSWKARVSAYSALVVTFRQTIAEDDPTFRPFVSNPAGVKEWVKDSNAVSQEKGVEAACALVEWGGKPAGRTRSEVVPAVVEKCLGSARAGTRAKAIELCLLFIEVEEDKGQGVIEDVMLGLAAKQPKVVAGSVSVFKDLVHLFGPKTIDVKPILQALPKIFAHSDKAVRLEGTLLCLALHSYLGPALTPYLASLKPVQVKELGEGFAEADGKGEGFGAVKQSRFTRTQQRERDVKAAEGTLGGNADEEAAVEAVEEAAEVDTALDPYELATPIDVLGSLPGDFYTHLASTKWKDRKDLALDPLLVLLRSSPRLQGGNYDELARALAGRMTDANVVCVMVAANCLEALASGLRNDFGRYKSAVLAPILERTKEKKTNVLDALGGALDALARSVHFGELVEEIITFGKHKNPSVKAETFKWLVRSLKVTPTPPSPPEFQPLTKVLISGLEDSGEPVRVAAAEGLGTLMKCVGERAFGGQLEGLDGLRKEKVMEWFEKAEVKCKVGAPPSRAAAPVVAAAPAAVKPKPKPAAPKPAFDATPDAAPLAPVVAKAALKPVAPPRLVVKKPPVTAAPVKKAAPATSGSGKAAPAKPVEGLRYKLTQEDAELEAESVIPPETLAGLADANWKARLGAIESMQAWLSGGAIETVESELLVRYLSKKPGWKESNFQVGAKMFGIFQLLAEQSPSFAKASAALSIPALSDKLGDMKLKKPAGDALTAYVEKSSLQFVLSQAYDPMTKQKAPKAQADSLVWVEQALRDFGIAGLSIRDLIEFLKNALRSTNAAVRTSATKTIVTLRLCVGSDISTFVQDLNPALLTTIEGEFDKIASEQRPEPTRVSADNAAAASSAGGANGASSKANEDAALDDLFPRVDLEKLLTSANVNACNDANWKARKEALELVQSTLEEHKRLKPSNLSDLTAALKARLSDSNKVVQTLALDVVARLATGMGKPFERQARILAGPTAAVLADQKAPIRAAGVAALSAMAEHCGLDVLISSFDKPLEAQNPILRKELLTWLESRFVDPEVVATLDVTPIVAAVIGCLEDRNVDVRKSATAVLPVIVAQAGYPYVVSQLSKLKPASRATVTPLVEAARGSAPAAPSLKAAAPSTKTAVPATKAAPAPRTGGLKPLRRPEAATAPTPPLDEPITRPSSARPRTSLPGIKPKSSASSARATPVPSSSAIKEPPFKSTDGQPKQIRQSKDVGSSKWVVEGLPRPEQIELLFGQMAPHTSAELLAQLFSKDHNAERDYVAGLASLDDCARDPQSAETLYDLSTEELAARLVANVDLIFKYITLRIGLSSTVITVKCLDLIDHLIPVLADAGHRLTDYEVHALLLSLIAKVGDSKESIRLRVRTIFKSLCTLYPFSKVFTVILDNGLVSKNSRTRAESAEELGSLFQRYGVSLFPIARALPLVARLISDRDAAVRAAALIAIGAAYTLVGADVVYKHIGTIPDKERTMLEERLKRTSSPVKGSASAAPSAPAGTPSRLAPSRSIPSGISRPAPSGLKRPTSVVAPPSPVAVPPEAAPPALRRPASIAQVGGASRLGPLAHAAPPPPSQAMMFDPDRVDNMIAGIVTDDVGSCVDVLKLVQADITTDPDSLLAHADQLVDTICQQIPAAFDGLDGNTSQSVLRLCKHLLQTLAGFFDNRTLAEAVSAEVLTVVLAELAGRLIDTSENQASEAVASLSKVLNMVLIRIFHYTDQGACFTALFTVLKDATFDLRELHGAELAERAKYAELVMKCVWKVSKTVKESLENKALKPERLLRELDNFLVATPPAEWRRRAADGIPLSDMPLRTVKTILSQVTSVYGESVFDKLDEIEAAQNSYVYQYLFRIVNESAGTPTRDSIHSTMARAGSTSSTSSLARVQTLPSPDLGSTHAGSLNGVASSSTKLSDGAIDIATNQELRVIFDRIGDPGNSRAGISELFEYRKAHPIAEAKIQIWMATTGNYFQTYLKRALDNLAIAERERESVSSGSNNFVVPISNGAGRPLSSASSRRTSVAGTPRTTPRSSRLSTTTSGISTSTLVDLNTNLNVGLGVNTPGTAGRLQELQNLFGFKDSSTGTFE